MYVRQAIATGERILSNASDARANRYARQFFAYAERRISYARNAVGNRNAC